MKMKSNLEYLRNLDEILLPQNFTYLHMNTYFQSERAKERYDEVHDEKSEAFTSIPTDTYNFNVITPFISREERVKEARKNPDSLIVNYPGSSKPFDIRVILPKKNLDTISKTNLNISDVDSKKLDLIYDGFGDQTRPKLFATNVVFIGSTLSDELTGDNIDILYAVREEDVDRYLGDIERSDKIEKNESLGSNLKFNRFLTYNPNDSNFIKGSLFEREYYRDNYEGEYDYINGFKKY